MFDLKDDGRSCLVLIRIPKYWPETLVEGPLSFLIESDKIKRQE